MLPALGGKKHPNSPPKLLPKKTGPGGLRSLQNEDPKRCLISASFSINFWTLLEGQIVPKWDLKSLKNLPWAAQGPPGTPTAARRPPWSYFGAFWDPFSSHLGAIMGPFGCHLGTSTTPLFSLARVLVLGASQLIRVGGCPR